MYVYYGSIRIRARIQLYTNSTRSSSTRSSSSYYFPAELLLCPPPPLRVLATVGGPGPCPVADTIVLVGDTPLIDCNDEDDDDNDGGTGEDSGTELSVVAVCVLVAVAAVTCGMRCSFCCW